MKTAQEILQEMIEEARYRINEVNPDDIMWEEYLDKAVGRKRGLEEALDRINKETLWIPVSERLPENGKTILVTGEIDRGILTYIEGVGIPDYITHWMYYPELPLPPKE